jgi:hypothetical protein
LGIYSNAGIEMKEILKILFFLPIYFKKYVFLAIFVYLLFFTKIFFFVFGLIILPVFDNYNVPMYKFVESPSCQPGGLAYFGDWMLDTLQPMVGDEKMIQNFHEHEKEMVELAAMANKNIPALFDNRQEWDVANALIKKLEKETDVELMGGGHGVLIHIQ